MQTGKFKVKFAFDLDFSLICLYFFQFMVYN